MDVFAVVWAMRQGVSRGSVKVIGLGRWLPSIRALD